MSYKRNQIEEAIARIFDPDCREPPSDLRTRIKRLHELDRSMGRKVRSKDPEERNFAFFSEEAPGTGVDISFSEYDAFALINGLRIMTHGWPQGFAVSVMHRVRVDLEREHGRILRQRPEELFYQQVMLARARPGELARARPGDLAVDNGDPVFLTIASKAPRVDQGDAAPSAAVCRGLENVGKFSRDLGASSVTLFEVATLAHRLHQELLKTEPRHRGRA